MKESKSSFVHISDVDAPDFPDEWYNFAQDDHFWILWRHRVLLKMIEASGLSLAQPLLGLDIGCGQGTVQRQIEQASEWKVDGADINRPALELSKRIRGESFLYNICEQRPEFINRYDFLILFDVIEHVDDDASFVKAAVAHLKPGGIAFINVPAHKWLYSLYDEAAGHCRRYSYEQLRLVLESAGLKVVDQRFWGLSMIPLALLRKAILQRGQSANDTVTTGFKPPSGMIDKILHMIMRIETSIMSKPISGTSLMSLARRS
jgi:SAM-dependent methyltransferase